MSKITKDTCPVGTRFLYKKDLYGSNIYEATVLEWSPCGNFFKYEPASNKGNSVWLDQEEFSRLELLTILDQGDSSISHDDSFVDTTSLKNPSNP